MVFTHLFRQKGGAPTPLWVRGRQKLARPPVRHGRAGWRRRQEYGRRLAKNYYAKLPYHVIFLTLGVAIFLGLRRQCSRGATVGFRLISIH